jgi:flavodoxin
MKSVVIYFSKFGNTQLAAEAIGRRLETAGPVELTDMVGFTPELVQDADLVVVGSPTHNMNLPKAAKPLLDELPKKMLKGVAVAAFDTSYQMSALLNRFTAGKKLARLLRKLGGKQVLPPEIFLVEGRQGPLVDGELERCGSWAEAILTRLDGRAG